MKRHELHSNIRMQTLTAVMQADSSFRRGKNKRIIMSQGQKVGTTPCLKKVDYIYFD